jgi:microcystin-dependent protein
MASHSIRIDSQARTRIMKKNCNHTHSPHFTSLFLTLIVKPGGCHQAETSRLGWPHSGIYRGGLALFLCLALNPRAAMAQANPNPPERMSYQGYLTDGNGVGLGTNAPKNYDVIFRIWNDQTAGTRLWAEQQTVTVDKGYFSVLLGEGSQYASEPHTNLSGIFVGPDVSERYVEFTVKGIGSGSPPADVTILPRLKLLTSPYAFLAKSASALTSPNGANLVTSANGQLTINGQLALSGAITGDGSGLTGLNASQISSGVLPGGRLSGSYPSALTLSNVNNNLSGNGSGLTSLNANNLASGTLPSARLSGTYSSAVTLNNAGNTFAGFGTVPLGGIIMWSGATVPGGWHLCDGTASTPDLRGRFVLGSGTGPNLTPRTAGQIGGTETHALTTSEMPSHNHSGSVATVGYTSSWNTGEEAMAAPNQSRNNGNETFTTANAGGGAAFDKMPPYYVLAFIMRTQ